MRRGENVRAFRHEVHAAEHDVVGVRPLRHLTGKTEGVAGVVGELDHLVALIVMTEDDEPRAERRARRGNAAIHLVVRQTEILLGQRLALGDVLLLELGQQRNDCGHVSLCPRSRPAFAEAPAGKPGHCETFRNLRT